MFTTRNQQAFTEGATPESKSSRRYQSVFSGSGHKDLLTLFVLGTAVLQVFVFFGVGLTMIWTARLSRKPAPTLVQMQDGTAVEVSPIPALERTPETIKRFVASNLTLLLSATGIKPQDGDASTNNSGTALTEKPRHDPGVDVTKDRFESGNKKIATTAWLASFSLEPTLREELLPKLAEVTPPSVFTGQIKVVLHVTHVSEPQLVTDEKRNILPGHWQVDVVATRYLFKSGNRIGEAKPVNKRVLVRSIYKFPHPLGERASDIEKAFYRVNQAALQIYSIADLTP